MKKINVLLIATLCLFVACQEMAKEPVFKEMTNIKVADFKGDIVTLKADALFNNPNLFGVQIIKTDVQVEVNGNKVGKVNQVKAAEMPAMSDFSVPVEIEFDTNKVFKSGGFWGKALEVLANRSLKVKYNGTVTVKALEIELELPIDFENEIELNL